MTEQACDDFVNFLTKLNERLIIILQYNTSQRIDPCESDIHLLQELYQMYDKTTLPWVKEHDKSALVYSQGSIFHDDAAEKE
jgi:hypothetical protein